MIFVDRTRVSEPEILRIEGTEKLRQLRDFFSGAKKKRSQKRIPFVRDLSTGPEVKDALGKLFHGKCAFCESRIESLKQATVEHFRPRQRARDLEGRVDPDHYWWLAYDWANLYLICKECRRHKATTFPTGATSRAAPEARGVDLLLERPLLLDPCADQPGEHLVFYEDGSVGGKTTRGETTINVLGLNRLSLVEERRSYLAAITNVADAFLMDDDPRLWKSEDFIKVALEELGEDYPFLQQARQFYSRHIQQAKAEAGEAGPTLHVYRPSRRKASYEGAIWVQKVEIENFRCLKSLTIEFPQPHQDREPWLMLLGENGVGKSSLLKAVALAMASPAQRKTLVPDAGSCVRQGASSKSGRICVTFNVPIDPVTLTFSQGQATFDASGKAPRTPLLAYGSTRLLPPSTKKARVRPQKRLLGNLFDPRVNLADAEPWITDTDVVSSDAFNLLATALKTLMTMEDEARIERRTGSLYSRLFGNRLAIRELSDGYQSVLALALDIMLNLSAASFDMENVEGTVLLDEIEVHLHPRWKISVINALRSTFPRVRFIVTTHDPLCLRGLYPGEVHLLSRDLDSKQIVATQIDPTPGLRADQLLTGAWFGLGSTRDRETLSLMEDHNALLLKKKKSKKELEKQKKIEDDLRQRLGEFAETPVEMIAQSAAAEFLQQQASTPDPDQRARLKNKILNRLKAHQARKG